jgi:hypothetical protein
MTLTQGTESMQAISATVGSDIVGRVVTARSLANTHMEPPSW